MARRRAASRPRARVARRAVPVRTRRLASALAVLCTCVLVGAVAWFVLSVAEDAPPRAVSPRRVSTPNTIVPLPSLHLPTPVRPAPASIPPTPVREEFTIEERQQLRDVLRQE